MSTPLDCPLCRQNNLLKERVIAETDGAYLIPAHSSPGNFLIIPEHHVEQIADLPDDWWYHMRTLISKTPHITDNFNISINCGKNAGQTVKHLHFWVIPRAGGAVSSGKGFARLIAEADSK